ncbi:hypothetical protein [Streptomyces hawaiiensis]|uniref:hypothetical protein n=1 Tax=Streptomyces hawaiiensis TaxID=67305 RepID=UPI003659BD02
MPDPIPPPPDLARIASDASTLRQALRAQPTDRASALASRITDAQHLAGAAL